MAQKKKRPAGNPWPKRLRAIRDRLALTQEEAAEKVGVTRRAWAAWEGNEQVPSSSLAILISLLEQGKI